MKLITDSGDEHIAFEIRVERGVGSAPFVAYATASYVDSQALRLSALMPEIRIRVETMSRIKATYLNGKRKEVRDYKNYFPNLTEEEYQATKIWCGTRAEWI